MNATHIEENAPAYDAIIESIRMAFREPVDDGKRMAMLDILDAMSKGVAPTVQAQTRAGIDPDHQIVCHTPVRHTGDRTPRFVFTRHELATAFRLVQSEENWKNPINQVLTLSEHPRARAMVLAAIDFFAGGGGKIETLTSPGQGTAYSPTVRVTAPGYYARIGA